MTGDTSHPTTVTEAMDEAAKRLESGAFADDPRVRADLERIVAESYAGQGKRQLSDEHIQKYLALVTEVYGRDHPKTLAANATRAKILFNNDQMAGVGKAVSPDPATDARRATKGRPKS